MQYTSTLGKHYSEVSDVNGQLGGTEAKNVCRAYKLNVEQVCFLLL